MPPPNARVFGTSDVIGSGGPGCTIGITLNEPEPDLQYEPGVVDPELVRRALQQIQHREGFGKGKVVPVWSVLIAAARYAIEDLQQKVRAASPKVPQGVEEWIANAQVQLGDESPAG